MKDVSFVNCFSDIKIFKGNFSFDEEEGQFFEGLITNYDGTIFNG
jgi:hypothetical protein